MVDKASSYSPDVILFDTAGFVLDEAEKELKRRKIDLISPRIILALQKHDEIKPILDQYKENPLYKILSLALIRTSQDEICGREENLQNK